MIVVLGSINLDLVATTPRLPIPGETITGDDFTTASGGKGANQALAALRAGADTRMVGAVGDDAFAAQALSELNKDNADLKGVAHVPGSTGIAVILVGGEGENVIVVIPGANGTITTEMATATVEKMSAGDILLLQQEIPVPAIAAAITTAKSHGVSTILNIAPFTSDSENLAKAVDIVIANETEFAGLAGGEVSGQALQEALAEMAQRNAQTIIVTLGAEGVLAATADNHQFNAKALPIKPVDTVGAGDTFCGYFAAALDAGNDLATALQLAAVAGSRACLKPGAQPAIPYRSEVDAALK